MMYSLRTRNKKYVAGTKKGVACSQKMWYYVLATTKWTAGGRGNMDGRGRVKVKLDALRKLQGNMSDAEFSRKIGVAPSTLFRIKLPDTDERHNDPGEVFIAKILNAYPDLKFEDLFFLDSDLRGRKNELPDRKRSLRRKAEI